MEFRSEDGNLKKLKYFHVIPSGYGDHGHIVFEGFIANYNPNLNSAKSGCQYSKCRVVPKFSEI